MACRQVARAPGKANGWLQVGHLFCGQTSVAPKRLLDVGQRRGWIGLCPNRTVGFQLTAARIIAADCGEAIRNKIQRLHLLAPLDAFRNRNGRRLLQVYGA